MKNLVILVALLSLVSCVSTSTESPAVKLTVFDCGELSFPDVSAFGLSNDETDVRIMFVPCYLIQHPDGNLLWDGGLNPDIAGQGEIKHTNYSMSYKRSVADQLAEMGIGPDDIDLMAFSHMHFDHVGAGKLFPDATLLIQQSEYEAAFINYDQYPVFVYDEYSAVADNPRQILNGDHDVFGDGSVQLVSAPGHTPGHQVLLVNLTNTGPLVLSGDLFHFRETRNLRRVPVFNTSAEETLASMDKVEALIESTGATLWIEHDMALAKTLRLAPASYD